MKDGNFQDSCSKCNAMESTTPTFRSDNGHFEWNDKMTNSRCASRLEIIEDGDIAHVLDFEAIINDDNTIVVWLNVLDEQGMEFIIDFNLSIARGDFGLSLHGNGQHSPGYPTSWIVPFDDDILNIFKNRKVEVGLNLSIDERMMPNPRQDQDQAPAA